MMKSMMMRLPAASSSDWRAKAVFTVSLPSSSRFLDAAKIRRRHAGGSGITLATRGFLSTSFLRTSSSSLPSHKFLGLGGHKAHRIPFTEYCQVVQTALEQGMPVLESTSVASDATASSTDEGGDALLAKAFQRAVEKSSHELSTKPVVVTLRLGYRTVTVHSNPEEATNKTTTTWPGDILLEEFPVNQHQQQQQPDAPPAMLQRVLHNLSSEYLQHTLLSSPLFQLAQEYPNITLLPLIHNPEAQRLQPPQTAGGAANDDLITKLTRAFVAMEQITQQHADHIQGFGVVSHGLTLPPTHPMYLDWKTVLLPAARVAAMEMASRAAASASEESSLTSKSNLSVIQLAANVLEPRGVKVAKAIQEHVTSLDVSFQRPLQIWAMRPMTSYPDATSSSSSSGSVYPRKLVDVPLPTTAVTDTLSPMQAMVHEPSNAATSAASTTTTTTTTPASSSNIQMTHTMSSSSPPLIYQQALANAMAHFDATDILEKKQSGDDLTTAERETWDGCKLLQSMLHDLDTLLTNTIQVDSIDIQHLTKSQQRCFTSWEEYQDYLFQQVIPVLHDTFEEYDDESGTVLQEFFAAYGIAMRHALCHQTRNIILKQTAEHDAGVVRLEPTMPLQEFALRYLLEPNSGITGVIVGCSQPKHVVKNVQTFKEWLKEQPTSTTSRTVEGGEA